MGKYVFLFKENRTDEDCCVRWIDLDELYSNNLPTLLMSCGYTEELKGNIEYKKITTILTEEEYEILCNPFGKDLRKIVKKLKSSKNQSLFETVQEEEKEYLMVKYKLSETDIENIFNEYSLDFIDRGIVGCIFNDIYDFAYDEMFSVGFMNSYNKRIIEEYFDFESFGNDLLDEREEYILLNDGRVVLLNY